MKALRNIVLYSMLLFMLPATAQDADDGWLKRKWGDMIARYNVYFNATQKLDAGVATLAAKQKDDFEEFLTVYPYGTPDDAKGMRESMDEVMKKASKVIQNRPRSKWADDAYFVIGQSHFFKGDYYAAIEAFQFVNTAYEDVDIKANSQLWLMKSYMQQERFDDAEAVLSLLKKNPSTDREYVTHLNLTAGDLLVKQQKYAEAITAYDKGLRKVKNRTLAYRSYFVLGQLYMHTKEFKKAALAFENVQKLNAPYDYVFQSNLGMAKSSAETGGSGISKTKKYLRRMLGDDKNIEYYDQIYYELAKLEFATGNEELGLEYMQASAANSAGNQGQRAKTYLYLADYYFTSRSYAKAQAYYDSTVSVLPSDYPDANKINAKHGVLSKLIQNIETIVIQDSLLALASMDRSKLDKKIEDEIKRIEQERILEEELLKIRQDQDALNGNTGPTAPTNSTGTWYFYNTSSVGRGYNDFVRTWGNRRNTDWWRFVNKSVTEIAVPKNSDPDAPDSDPDTYVSDLDKEQQDALKDISKEKIEYYKNIPFSATAKIVAERKIEDAYMGNGKIYFDDLREFEKSKSNFKTLIERFTTTAYMPEALFYLAKNEKELGNTAGYDAYAFQIQKEYPNTTFNKVLNATEVVEDTKDKEVVALYNKMYDAYQVSNFDGAIAIKKQIETDFQGNSIQAKIDYLYALIIGKTKGKEAYISELEIVAADYAGNEVGEMAAYTLRMLKQEKTNDRSDLLSDKFTEDKASIHYYVVTGITEKESEVQVKLDEFNKKYFGTEKLTISSILLGDKQLFYIRQFKTSQEAMAYHKDFRDGKNEIAMVGISDLNFYAISEANFRALVKDQIETEYITFFNATYN